MMGLTLLDHLIVSPKKTIIVTVKETDYLA